MIEGSYYCTSQCDTGTMHLMHEGVVEMYIQDGQLKGTMISTFYWLPSNFVGGTVNGDRFEFDAFWNTPCQQFALHVKGSVRGDDLEAEAESFLGVFQIKGYRVSDSYKKRKSTYPYKPTFQRTLNERKFRK